jgi:hypothetical protein
MFEARVVGSDWGSIVWAKSQAEALAAFRRNPVLGDVTYVIVEIDELDFLDRVMRRAE